jgi:uncharacterized protein YjdB
VVTAVSPGTATITVATLDGGKTATCAVVATATAPVWATGVALNKDAVELSVGDSYTLVATVLPENATNKNVSWSSSAPGVASVSNGLVTALASGSATITVTTQDGAKTAYCTVTVVVPVVPVTGVTLDRATLALAPGDSYALVATALPENATNKNVTWSSSAPGVASVSNGIMTGVADGTAIITVTTQDGGHTASCEAMVAVSPVRVRQTTIMTSNYFNLAIKADGSLWPLNPDNHYSWGTDSDWVSLYERTYFLKANGSLWTGTPYGNLTRVGNGYAVATMAGDRETGSSLAIKADGSLWAWGANDYGQLGLGAITYNQPDPVRVGTGSDWVSVAAADKLSLGLKTDGSLWVWGFDYATVFTAVPTRVGTDNDWAAVASDGMHRLAIKTDGSLWAWGGDNVHGVLGLGDTAYQHVPTVPTRVGTDNDWVSVTLNGICSLGIKTDGSLWARGRNYDGRLGFHSNQDVLTPTLVGTGFRVPGE